MNKILFLFIYFFLQIIALSRHQSWLTYVSSDDFVTNALVLAESLRRVRTTKRICVVTSGDVSVEKRILLRQAFDHVFYLGANIFRRNGLTNGNGTMEKDELVRVKTFAFSLRLFEKCIFLGSNTLVLENMDQLFESDPVFKDLSDGLSDEVFLFSPSLELCEYLELTYWKEGSGGKSFTQRIEQWLINNMEGKTNKTEDAPVSLMQLDLEHGRLLTKRSECWGRPAVVEFVNGTAGKRLDNSLMEFLRDNQDMGLTEKVRWNERFSCFID